MSSFTQLSHTRRGSLLLAPRFWISLAICAFFSVMAVLLWRREAGLRIGVRKLGFSADFMSATWVDYDQFMWIERGGERSGVYHIRVRRVDETGKYTMTLRGRVMLELFGNRVPVSIDTQVDMSERFELEVFRGRLELVQPFLVESFVEGDQAYYRLTGPEGLIGPEGIVSRVTLDEPLMLADAIRPIVTQSRRLKVGNRWRVDAGDPLLGAFDMPVLVEVEALEEIEVEGEMVQAFRIVETAGDTETVSWYSPGGEVLRSEVGKGIFAGLVMIKAQQDEAFARYPDLKLPPIFEDIDRDAIRERADAAEPTETRGLIPWPSQP